MIQVVFELKASSKTKFFILTTANLSLRGRGNIVQSHANNIIMNCKQMCQNLD